MMSHEREKKEKNGSSSSLSFFLSFMRASSGIAKNDSRLKSSCSQKAQNGS